jgi:predicted RNase H-like nuclease (RuvC/YqgF family)
MSDTPMTDKVVFNIYRESSSGELTGRIQVVPASASREIERRMNRFKNISRESLDQAGKDSDEANKMQDEIDNLKKQLMDANAKIIELQGQLIWQTANQQTSYAFGIRT